MGWEKRGNQSYYYHKKRKSGQTVSTYAGRGVLAQLQVQILEDEQRVRQAGREDLRCIQQQDRDMDRQMGAAEKTLRLLTDARFYAEGFHKHKGQWRKRRDA